MVSRAVFLMLLLLLVIEAVNAAVIQGTVYDLSLNPVEKCIVEIDSTPMQRYVTSQGRYSFNLQKGDYIITAKFNDDYASENITISDDGTYNLDMFLFPSLDEDITDDLSIDLPFEEENYTNYFIVIIIVLAAIFIAYIRFKKRNKKEIVENKKDIAEPANLMDDKEKIIQIIKKQGSRTTQKDIRKETSLSEAKVSLVIAELEHESKIKKIKKGRGNIIILNEQSSK